MNINEALSRNRAIFEKLTDDTVHSVEVQNKQTNQTIQKQHHEEEAPKKPLEPPIYEEREEERQPIFSLKHMPDETVFDFSAPATVTYPEISAEKQSMTKDPLENLYYRLEVDARRGSQLLNEEE